MFKRLALFIPIIPTVLFGSAAIYCNKQMQNMGTFVILRSFGFTAVAMTIGLQLLMNRTLFANVIHSDDYYERCLVFGCLMSMGSIAFIWMAKNYPQSMTAFALAGIPVFVMIAEIIEAKEITAGQLALLGSFILSLTLYCNYDKMDTWVISWK